MNMSGPLPHRWRGTKEAGLHNQAIAGILQTPAIKPARDGLVIFSMIGTQAVLPYLVAVKSLWQQLGRGRIAILDDGSLSAQDRAVLAQHCGDPQILRMGDVAHGGFPTGDGWERLLTILDHRAGEYWLQLDKSTVTLGPVWEVERAIASNRSFTLMDSSDAPDQPLELPAFARSSHIGASADEQSQAHMERLMAHAAPDLGWKYLRGCSAFAGFAAGNAGRDLAAAFLARMKAAAATDGDAAQSPHQLGHQLGHQLAANFLIANEGAPVCLPYTRYLNYRARRWDHGAAFVHFGSSYRHENSAYLDASLKAIARLGQ